MGTLFAFCIINVQIYSHMALENYVKSTQFEPEKDAGENMEAHLNRLKVKVIIARFIYYYLQVEILQPTEPLEQFRRKGG